MDVSSSANLELLAPCPLGVEAPAADVPDPETPTPDAFLCSIAPSSAALSQGRSVFLATSLSCPSSGQLGQSESRCVVGPSLPGCLPAWRPESRTPVDPIRSLLSPHFVFFPLSPFFLPLSLRRATTPARLLPGPSRWLPGGRLTPSWSASRRRPSWQTSPRRGNRQWAADSRASVAFRAVAPPTHPAAIPGLDFLLARLLLVPDRGVRAGGLPAHRTAQARSGALGLDAPHPPSPPLF